MTLKWRRTISVKTRSPPNSHSKAQENKFRFEGGYFMTLKWRRTISVKTRSPPNSYSEAQENKFRFVGEYFHDSKMEAYNFVEVLTGL